MRLYIVPAGYGQWYWWYESNLLQNEYGDNARKVSKPFGLPSPYGGHARPVEETMRLLTELIR